jgi:hypothetical protein
VTIEVIDLGTGQTLWQFNPVQRYGFKMRLAGFADLDNDGVREAVLVKSGFGQGSFYIAVIDWSHDDAEELRLGSPTKQYSLTYLGDVDGDSQDELVALTYNLQNGAVATEIYGSTASAGVFGVGPSGPGPADLSGLSNHPNPVSDRTSLTFQLPRLAEVSLRVYDQEGRLVRDLGTEILPHGLHEIVWDGRDGRGRLAAPGVYFARLITPDSQENRKLVLAR